MIKSITSETVANVMAGVIIAGLAYTFNYHEQVDTNANDIKECDNRVMYLQDDVKLIRGDIKALNDAKDKLNISNAVTKTRLDNCSCD
jgi:outer membrane murein-binding lipoprotein Lpp